MKKLNLDGSVYGQCFSTQVATKAEDDVTQQFIRTSGLAKNFKLLAEIYIVQFVLF